ncbi:tape measure protein [Rhizobium rhizogenes]|uniref:tape measure protein n=1 Tax=Rhizobium rhizogenes TaxID=359 RepID=UPI003ECC1BCA
MAGKDINLVIRAKDNATKEISSISKSLKALTENQSDLSKGAGKTSTALGGLAADVQKLQRQTDQLKSLGRIASELDKATTAVGKMETSLRGNAVELAKLARDSDAAAASATKLKAALASEESALASNKAGLKATSAELTKVNKLVADAEKAQTKYNAALGKPAKPSSSAVGRDIGAPQTSARASAGTFIAADLAAAKATQAQVTAQVKEYQGAITQASSAIKELRPQVAAASAVQKTLADDTSRAAAALSEEKSTLASARTSLGTISDVSKQASTALGVVAISQEDVSAAAAKMSAQLAAAKSKIDALSTVKVAAAPAVSTNVGGIDVGAIDAQRRSMLEARREWVNSQAAVKALAQELKSAENPTEQLGAAFGRAQAQATLAKQAYDAQRNTLVSLSGSAKSSFLAFSQGASSLQKVSTVTGGVVSSQQQLAPAIQRSGAASSGAASSTSSFASSLGNLQNNSRQTLSVIQRLRGEILSLTASYIGFQAAISQVGGATDAFQQLEATQGRLGAVFNQDTAKVSTEIGFLREQSDRLGISFGTLGDEYGKFTIAANAANFTTGETRKIFLSVAEAARVNRLTVDQTSGVFLALTQMISKGKVSAEELRGQLGERLPGAFNIFASAIGKSTAELDKMMTNGEVLADRSTLLKFADELSKRFGPQLTSSLDSLSTDIGRFQNDIFNAQLEIANGLVPALRDALKSFDEFAKSAEGQQTFGELGQLIGKFISILAEVPKYFDEISVAAKVFAAIKLAEVFTGIAGKLISTGAAATAFSSQIQLIGPRTQQAAQAQGVLNRGLSQVVSTLGSYRQNLLASTTATTVARVGVTALAGGVGILRSALILTGTVARSFLAAFGGPVGLAITAITLLVGNWLTSVNTATTALTEHQRQLRAVSDGYNNAKDKAGDWAKKVSGVSIAQAMDSTENLRKEFNKTADSMRDLGLVLQYAFHDLPSTSPQAQQLKQLQDALAGVKTGSTGLKDLGTILNDIALNPADEQFKEIALQLLKMLNTSDEAAPSLEELQKAISDSEAKLAVLNGTATDAQKVQLGLKQAVDDTADSFDKAAAIKAYTDAIDKLKSHIPALADELKKLKELTEINTTAWGGLVAAFKSGDVSAMAKIVGLWMQASGAVQSEFEQKQFNNLPDTSKSVVDRIMFVEGGQTKGTDTNKPGSSAQGIGQFTESTWLPLFNRLFPALSQLSDDAKLQYRYNVDYAKPILEQLTKDNQMALSKGGAAPDPTNTYLAHFLGAGDALKVILANPDALAKTLVDPKSVAANPTVIKDTTTAGDLRNWAAQKMGGGSPIMSGGQTKQENFNEDFDQTVKGLKQVADARADSNREGFIAQQLAEQESKAQKEGVTLTAEQVVELKEAAGAKYDSAHADEQLKKNQSDAREQLNDIVGLDQQRKVLLQEIAQAQNEGDNAKVTDLKGQLTGINTELDAAIPKALALANSLGDEKMVAQLKKVQLNTAKVGSQFSILGLNFNQVKELAGSFADGIVGMFDSFAESVANGTNGIKALGQAFLKFAADFLRQIANMILKQTVFNLLNSIFPGLGLGTSAVKAHTGGMVGSAAAGGGNSSKTVSPMWFANAMRYHTGGIAGLRPDEVPAVLKKNEEVLTEEDPRHRYNAGGTNASSGAAATAQPIKQVLVLDQKDLANALASSAGQKVVITHIKNNASTIKQILG